MQILLLEIREANVIFFGVTISPMDLIYSLSTVFGIECITIAWSLLRKVGGGGLVSAVATYDFDLVIGLLFVECKLLWVLIVCVCVILVTKNTTQKRKER